MKKTLLLITISYLSVISTEAQKVWNFSDFAAATFTETTVINDLTIMAGASSTVVIDANQKINGSFTFTQRAKLGGSGSATGYMPSTRSFVFNVSGPGEIKVAALSSSSSTDRRLILTNGTDSLSSFSAPGAYTDGTDNIPMNTYNYTGSAATLYLYSVSSGVNVYYLSAASAAPTSIKGVVESDMVQFNGASVINNKGLSVDIYNCLGRKVLNSCASEISMSDLAKGIYVVRIVNSNKSIKVRI